MSAWGAHSGTNTCFKVVGRNRIDQGNIEKSWVVMGTSFALPCCRAAAFFTMKPALHTPLFKKNARS